MIRVKNLTKIYNKVKALDDLSLKINRGEIFGLLGPNGSGKSTLLGCICGLLQPDSGEIFVDDKLLKKSDVTIRRKFIYLPQHPYFEPSLTGAEIVRFYDKIRGTSKLPAPLWQRSSLDELMKKKVGAYSKGMIQRLGLFLTLRYDVPLYLFDEPTANLDQDGVSRLRHVFKELRTHGKTIVFSTHLPADCESLADRMGSLLKGKMKLTGSVYDVKKYLLKLSELSVQIKNPEEKFVEVCFQKGAQNVRYEKDHLVFWIQPSERLPLIHLLEKNGAEIINIGATNGGFEKYFMHIS